MKILNTRYTLNIGQVASLIKSQGIFKNPQVSVTSRKGLDNYFDGVGRITDYDAEERDFNKINDMFIGTDIERVLNQIQSDGLSYGRVRILNLEPGKTYSYHMDCETRLHFAIETNDSCMFIVDDEVIRIPNDGIGYILNTTLLHTAINASHKDRIHLVIDLLYPVKKEDNHYIIQGKPLSEDEFQAWLIETKPPTESKRQDYYFI